MADAAVNTLRQSRQLWGLGLDAAAAIRDNEPIDVDQLCVGRLRRPQ
jgi:hypothetical protein